MREMSARQFIKKRDALDAYQKRLRDEVRVMLPRVGAIYGLHGEALKFAMDAAIANVAHAHACLSAIERSLVPR